MISAQVFTMQGPLCRRKGLIVYLIVNDKSHTCSPKLCNGCFAGERELLELSCTSVPIFDSIVAAFK